MQDMIQVICLCDIIELLIVLCTVYCVLCNRERIVKRRQRLLQEVWLT